MKILHVENIAGVATTISRAQRELGHQSDVLITWPNKYNYPVDYSLIYNKRIKIPIEMNKVINLMKKYDVIHIHGGLPLKRLDLVLNKILFSKPYLVHFHGSETRMGYGIHYGRFVDKGVVSTPDLLRWLPNYLYIPNPVRTPNFERIDPKPGSIRIVHLPSNRRFKGTEVIERAIRLLMEKGLQFDFKIIEGVSNETARKEIAQSHIVIDWISREDITGIPGIYGVVSLEAMSLGRVAVAYLDKSIRPYYPSNLPIISPTSTSAEDLAECLEELMQDRGKMIEISEKGPPYVREHHDPSRCASRFIDEYNKIL